MKKILTFFIALWFFGIFGGDIHAADFSITCDNSGCTPGVVTDFFDTTEPWYPLQSMTQRATLTNSGTESQFVGQRARNVSTSSGANIAEVLDVTVVREYDNTLLWSGTLQDLYDGGEIGLGTILPGETITYVYTVAMRDVGNDYQGKSTSFDLDIGYIEQVSTNTSTPTSQPGTSNSGGGGSTSQSTSSNSGGGTGEVLGAVQANPFRSLVRSVRSAFGISEESVENAVRPTTSPEKLSENILGEQDEVCQNASWWWLVILIYGAIGVLFYGLGKRIKRLARIVLHGLLTAVAIVLLVYALCNWLFAVILTAVIGIITQLLIESHAQE